MRNMGEFPVVLLSLSAVCRNKAKPFPLLDLPTELVEKVVSTLGPQDQAAKKAARASCTQLRSAVNAAVSRVKVWPSCLTQMSVPHTYAMLILQPF